MSCTGAGEYLHSRDGGARHLRARANTAESMRARRPKHVIERRLERIGGHGGAIVVDRNGNVISACNTDVMYYGKVTHDTRAATAIYASEHD